MQNPTLVVCIFDNASSAVDAIHELRRTGFSDDQLGIVVRRDTDEHGINTLAREIISDLLGATGRCLLPDAEINIPIKLNESVTTVKVEPPLEKRSTGIIIGGVIGGTLGTIAILQPPEIGMIVVGGVLTAILGDAAPGGIAANFLRLGVPISNARHYAQKFQEGLIIFMIKAAEQQEAQDILHYHRAHNIEVH